MQDYLLTMMGPDRTGMVAGLAGILARHDGNWLDSRMVRLGGTFSGLLRLQVSEASGKALAEDLEEFLSASDYRYTLQSGVTGASGEAGRIVSLSVSGQDHPGIVNGIFSAFEKCGANVEELRSGLQAAPWSGTPVFEANARVRLPAEVSLDSLQEELESIASDLMVELDLSEG